MVHYYLQMILRNYLDPICLIREILEFYTDYLIWTSDAGVDGITKLMNNGSVASVKR